MIMSQMYTCHVDIIHIIWHDTSSLCDVTNPMTTKRAKPQPLGFLAGYLVPQEPWSYTVLQLNRCHGFNREHNSNYILSSNTVEYVDSSIFSYSDSIRNKASPWGPSDNVWLKLLRTDWSENLSDKFTLKQLVKTTVQSENHGLVWLLLKLISNTDLDIHLCHP